MKKIIVIIFLAISPGPTTYPLNVIIFPCSMKLGKSSQTIFNKTWKIPYTSTRMQKFQAKQAWCCFLKHKHKTHFLSICCIVMATRGAIVNNSANCPLQTVSFLSLLQYGTFFKDIFFAIFTFIMIGQIRADRKWSGREMGAGSGKVLESGFELGTSEAGPLLAKWVH